MKWTNRRLWRIGCLQAKIRASQCIYLNTCKIIYENIFQIIWHRKCFINIHTFTAMHHHFLMCDKMKENLNILKLSRMISLFVDYFIFLDHQEVDRMTLWDMTLETQQQREKTNVNNHYNTVESRKAKIKTDMTRQFRIIEQRTNSVEKFSSSSSSSALCYL